MRNDSDKIVEKIKTHILCSIFFFKSYRLRDNVEKYGRAGQATDGNIIRRLHIAFCITKAADTLSENTVLLLFHCNNAYAKSPL